MDKHSFLWKKGHASEANPSSAAFSQEPSLSRRVHADARGRRKPSILKRPLLDPRLRVITYAVWEDAA